jgi:hypothetical protein
LLLALRVVAGVGTAAVVLVNAASLASLKPRQEYGFLVLVLAVLGVGLTLRVFLWPAAGRLTRHPDLLLPLGLFVTAEALLGLLAAVPLFAPGRPVTIFSITVTLSLLLVIGIVLGVVYIGWTTTLVLQAVRHDRVDPLSALSEFPRWFGRALVVGVIGWVVLFAGLVVFIPIGKESMALGGFLIGAGALVWNLATAALLVVAVAEHGPFATDLRSGFRVSWAGKRRWWFVLLVQMVLLGWVTYFHAAFTSNPRPGVFHSQTKESFNVHGFWTGGYADTCHWHADVMKTVEADPLPVVTTLLGLVFAVLAIAIKLRIAVDVYGRTGGPEPEARSEGEGGTPVGTRF